MILGLEWPGCVYQNIRTDIAKLTLYVAVDVDDAPGGRLCRFQRCSEGVSLGLRSTTDQELDVRVCGKGTRYIAAEVTIAANDQNPDHQLGFATISQKTTTSPRNAGQPSRNQSFLNRSYFSGSKLPPATFDSSILFILI